MPHLSLKPLRSVGRRVLSKPPIVYPRIKMFEDRSSMRPNVYNHAGPKRIIGLPIEK